MLIHLYGYVTIMIKEEEAMDLRGVMRGVGGDRGKGEVIPLYFNKIKKEKCLASTDTVTESNFKDV